MLFKSLFNYLKCKNLNTFTVGLQPSVKFDFVTLY